MANGTITTFYSFKGGVGRSMALANLAFLTAFHGKRVLVMDWDLEAPGLVYYFRGLFSGSNFPALTSAPGILDMLGQWQSGIHQAESEADVSALQQGFTDGSVFQQCARPLLDSTMQSKFFANTACLDIISAGAPSISSMDNLPYEAALAQFSWADFFEKHAGGFVLEAMRNWAKAHYDIILIDSRTGLADIAGICTMQLPDVVALCLVLNQQNIDGICKVAAAIRAQRPGEVRMRVLPMRVPSFTSFAWADALARAANALTQKGGFTAEQVKLDLDTLKVAHEDHLPPYETLAPFAAEQKFDRLSLTYLSIAKDLLDPSITAPDFPEEMLQYAKQRLQPNIATAEYLQRLRDAEPSRAAAELRQLIAAGQEHAANGGGFDADYLTEMLELCVYFVEMDDISEDGFEQINKILDILRILHKRDPQQWRGILIEGLKHILIESGLFEIEKSLIPLWKELDQLLECDDSIPRCLRAHWIFTTCGTKLRTKRGIAPATKNNQENYNINQWS